MVEDFRTLFDNEIFEKSLGIQAINNKPFVIKHFSSDSRITEAAELYCFIGIKGERFDGNDFFEQAYEAGVRVFLLQKAPAQIPNDAIIYLVDDTIIAIGKIAHEHRKNQFIPAVLITGSVGKTTTRQILTAVLRQKYAVHTAQKNWNNDIGLPLTLLETREDAKISVLEAGMNHQGEISYLSKLVNPEIAVITNIGYSHAEFFDNMDEIANAKIEIVDGMDEASILLVNKHDPYRELFESKAKGKVLYFDPQLLKITKDMGVDGFEFTHNDYPEEIFMCPIPGEHLLLNLSIVFALIDVLQIPVEYINQGLQDIQGLNNRMDIFKTSTDITVIADCYNASLESFKAALNVLGKSEGRKIAVVGSVLEMGDMSPAIHKEIGQYINEINPYLVLATGPDIDFLCNELRVPYCQFQHKEDIWSALESQMKPSDTILVKASNGVGLNIIVDCLAVQ